jgi:DNA-binding TFAR19-related protein (PDSD5 family)
MPDDEEVGDIQKKKLDARKANEQLKTALRAALDESAYDRIMNVAVANKELYLNAAQNVMMFYKRAGRKLTEAELLSLLRAIRDQGETKTSITFHKK